MSQPTHAELTSVIQAIYAGTDQPVPAPTTPHPSHQFGGEDGRCFACDCRPYGRWSPLPCDGA